MKFGTFAATAVLAVAALGITAGTVSAEPTAVVREVSTSGIEQGVGYRTALPDSTGAITTAVEGGKFELANDGTKVSLKSDSGAVVAEVPLTFDISGSRMAVAQEIRDNGRTLALTPKVSAANIGEMQPVNSMARLTDEINKNVVGVVAGGVVGGLLGALIGLGIFSIITGPIGLLVGAIAGGYVMGGQPFMDAMMAVVRGEP
jgi:outer membrane lipoprotein SlyB